MSRLRMFAAAATLAAGCAAGTWAGEQVAFLGIATEPVDPMVSYQLGLPEGVGLAVIEVREDGAVKGKVAVHDVLQKLDDQLLTGQEQLSILVRARKPGDEVALTVTHRGKTEEIKVKLGGIDAEQLGPAGPRSGMVPFGRWNRQGMTRGMGHPGVGPEADEDQNATPQAVPHKKKPMRVIQGQGGSASAGGNPGSQSSVTVSGSHASSQVMEQRDGKKMSLKQEDGKSSLKIEDDGKTIFEGPVDTEEQLNAVPQEYRDWAKKMKGQTKIEIHTNFKAPGLGKPI